MNARVVLFLASMFFTPLAFSQNNVILFIGDGMGPSTVQMARVATRGSSGSLTIDSLPHTAIVKTYSSDHIVTDSASAATSIASGVKTGLGVVGMDRTANPRTQSGGKPVTPISKIAKEMGYAVGIVTNTRITHATPGAFYAHVPDRSLEEKMASQLLSSPYDLFLGGGAKFFKPSALSKSGFRILKNRADLRTAKRESKKQILGLFSDDHLEYMIRRKSDSREPTLSELTRFAISNLKRRSKNFFLIVEGGRIDHAAHENLAREMIDEVIEFDRALKVALELSNPKETLLIVTADHETGGATLSGYLRHGESIFGSSKDFSDPKAAERPYITFANGPLSKAYPMDNATHTAVDVHGYAWGVGADQMKGTIDNTAIFGMMKSQLRVLPIPKLSERPPTRKQTQRRQSQTPHSP